MNNTNGSTILFSPERLNAVKQIMEANMKRTGFIKNQGVGKYTEELGAILYSVACGKIVPYKNNRGTGMVNTSLSKKSLEDFNIYAFGKVTFGKRNGVLTIVDGNSRIEWVLKKIEGCLEDNNCCLNVLLSTPIQVEIVPESEVLRVYEALNSGKSHSTSEKLTNPDFLYGYAYKNLMSRLSDLSAFNLKDLEGHKKIAQLSYIFCCFVDGSTPTCYLQLFNKRTTVNKTALSDRDSVCFKNSQYYAVEQAIRFYFDVKNLLIEGIRDKDTLRKILRSGPFFGLLVSDYVFGKHVFGTSALILSKKIIGRASTVVEQSVRLTASTADKTDAAEEKLISILGVKRQEK